MALRSRSSSKPRQDCRRPSCCSAHFSDRFRLLSYGDARRGWSFADVRAVRRWRSSMSSPIHLPSERIGGRVHGTGHRRQAHAIRAVNRERRPVPSIPMLNADFRMMTNVVRRLAQCALDISAGMRWAVFTASRAASSRSSEAFQRPELRSLRLGTAPARR